MTQRQLLVGTLSAFIVVSLSTARQVNGQSVRRDTSAHAAQKPVVRRASVDSLVECSPVAAPAKKKPVARRRKASVTAPRKIAVQPVPNKIAARSPGVVVRRAKRVTPKRAKAAPSHTTTIVMCRPVSPIAPLAQGTPTEKSVIPVPRLASAAAPAAEDGPPLFVSTAPGAPALLTAGNGRSWLPLSVIPAVFVPFIHSGRTHHGSTTPIDSMPPRDTVPVIPPVTPPTTTVPEPGMLVMLGSGLLGLAGVTARKRKR